jgi:hypothetical protein
MRQGNSYEGYGWLMEVPDNDEGDYCWQPLTETFTLDTDFFIPVSSIKLSRNRPSMAYCEPPNELCNVFRYIVKGDW